jgi:hypothetical protein
VVWLAGVSEYRAMDGRAAARSLRAPVLYAVARRDGCCVGAARELLRLTPGKAKRLSILPGGKHGVALLVGSTRARTRSVLFAFLAQVAPPA